jgi:hypothetical protein
MSRLRRLTLSAIVAATLALPLPAQAGSYQLTLNLSHHLHAGGRLQGTGNPAPPPFCEMTRTIKVQRRSAGHWNTVATDETNNRGRYGVDLPDRPGLYRAKAPRESGCQKVVSDTERHEH